VQVGQKQGAAAGLALGGMQFVMFCSYAIALYYGAVRVSQVRLTVRRSAARAVGVKLSCSVVLTASKAASASM
jgi:ATP-binding cassette subfamily B (MDR/TAP) protein 1